MVRSKCWVACIATFAVFASGWVGLTLDPVAAPMQDSAEKLLAALSPEQRGTASFPFNDAERLNWHFIPRARKGLPLKQMNAEQRKATHELLQSGLSEIGFHKATTIMSLESILHELEKDRKGGPVRDPDLYFLSLFGTPAARGEWGWRIEGHHLALNFVVRDGKLAASTPAFFGANPATIQSDVADSKKGNRVLAKEELLAFELIGSLNESQLKTARIAEQAPTDVRSANTPQPPADRPVGLPAAQLTDAQRKLLEAIIETYAANMPESVAKTWLGEVHRSGIEKVHFAWAGATKPGVGHYYRVQGPDFLIEFVNVQPDSAGNPANHIHSFWRSLHGDFGIPR